jgi:hypothetical protein
MHGAGGSESLPADSTASLRMAAGFPDEDTYTQGDEDVLSPRPADPDVEPECGCVNPSTCRCPKGDMVGENLLRAFIRESMGAFGRAPTDLGEMDNFDVDDWYSDRYSNRYSNRYSDDDNDDDVNDDDDNDDDVEEDSGAGALGGGPSLPLGMSTPTFGREREEKGQEVSGFKPVH